MLVLFLLLGVRSGGAESARKGSDHEQQEPPASAAAPPISPPRSEPLTEEEARDAAIFGSGSETAPPPGAKDGPASGGASASETAHREASRSSTLQDPLRIGGMLYLRSISSLQRGLKLEDATFATPSLLDVYLDARPNDRVRGFVLGRLSYDAAREGAASGDATALSTGGTSGTSSLSSIFARPSAAPRGVLDQVWIRFDVARTMFVTAGKQHVRWGTGRFWAPTDFLHLRRRNPLDVFDARAGTSMLKLHLPIESKAWNLYGYAVTENPAGTPSLSHVAGAARAEFVVGTLELGLGTFARKGQKPRFAGDVSFGLGDFDVYGELGVVDAGEVDRVRFDASAGLPPASPAPSWQTPEETARVRLAQVVDARYPIYRSSGYHPQLTAGFTYSARYGANDTLTLGAEYFYNALGYEDPADYLGLVLPHSRELSNAATFFYLGRHYGALYVSLPSPFSLDLHSFTLSTLSNVSDGSIVTRLDYALTLLTHLRFEAFAALRYGKSDGEFRLGIAPVQLGEATIQNAPAVLDVGLALRLTL